MRVVDAVGKDLGLFIGFAEDCLGLQPTATTPKGFVVLFEGGIWVLAQSVPKQQGDSGFPCPYGAIGPNDLFHERSAWQTGPLVWKDSECAGTPYLPVNRPGQTGEEYTVPDHQRFQSVWFWKVGSDSFRPAGSARGYFKNWDGFYAWWGACLPLAQTGYWVGWPYKYALPVQPVTRPTYQLPLTITLYP